MSVLSFPSLSGAAIPGVTVTQLGVLAPAGTVTANPAAPAANQWRYYPIGSPPTNAPLQISGGVASGARVGYRAEENATCFWIGGPAGDSSCAAYMRTLLWSIPDGPFIQPLPGRPEPSLAVCGWRSVIRHFAAAAAVGVGHGWMVGNASGGGGNPWESGTLPPEGGDFYATATIPYVVLEVPAGGGPMRVRVRGNDGTVRFHQPDVDVDPVAGYSVDWRVYRATQTRPARYALFLNGLLAWSQSMSEGPNQDGTESASPSAGAFAIYPAIWQQRAGGTGAKFLDLAVYAGYDNASTVDRQ